MCIFSALDLNFIMPASKKPSTSLINNAKVVHAEGTTNGGGGGGAGKEEVATSGKIITPNLKMYSFAELKSTTRNFRPDTIWGEGGFGRVFEGWVDNKTLAPSKVGIGMAVAVKKSNQIACKVSRNGSKNLSYIYGQLKNLLEKVDHIFQQ